MSKLKSPQEKKSVSLNRDRRNNYGENDKASRKAIPRNKQNNHQAERRAANRPVAALKGNIEEDVANAAEMQSRAQVVLQKRKGFRKRPDISLGDMLARKRT